MKMREKIIVSLLGVLGLAACATNSEPVMNDGVAEPAPVGTNLKTKKIYRRGGSSSSVKVMTREQVEEKGVTADDVLRPD